MAHALLLAAAAAALLAAPAAAACATALDCGLGGACLANGTCACREEWTGPNCTQLNLQPARRWQAFAQPNTSSWGGSVVPGSDGFFYMSVAVMDQQCGLNSWESNSKVTLARSAAPDGPYEPLGDLLPPFAHNPTAHYVHLSPSGTALVVAHIGQGTPEKPLQTNCSGGVTPPAAGALNHVAGGALPLPADMAVAGTPLPPPNFLLQPAGDPGAPLASWRVLNSSGGGWADNNPALWVEADGSALLIYKVGCACPGGCFCRQFALASAPDWSGPYSAVGLLPAYGEDAYLWRDPPSAGGGYHFLFQGGSYPGTPAYVGHWHTAYSPDALNVSSWTVAADSNAFSPNITLEGGGQQVPLVRRERHQVLFDPETGAPAWLFNGALPAASGATDRTMTVVQPIGNALARQRAREGAQARAQA